MRIALLTMTFNNNYGEYLQTYTLMSYLKELGHDVEIFNAQLEDDQFKKLFITYYENFIKRNIVTYLMFRRKNETFLSIWSAYLWKSRL